METRSSGSFRPCYNNRFEGAPTNYTKPFTIHVYPSLQGTDKVPTVEFIITDHTATTLSNLDLQSRESVASFMQQAAARSYDFERDVPIANRTTESWSQTVKSIGKNTIDPEIKFAIVGSKDHANRLARLPSFRSLKVPTSPGEAGSEGQKRYTLLVEPLLDGNPAIWPAWNFYTGTKPSRALTDKELGGDDIVRAWAAGISEAAQSFEEGTPAQLRTVDAWAQQIEKVRRETNTHECLSFGFTSIDRTEGRAMIPEGMRKCDSTKWTRPNRDKAGKLL